MLGHYKIRRPLGRGGMGSVYLALDCTLDREVAIKLLHETDDHERLVRESKALARLNHPNVVTVHEVGRHGETSYLVMEYLAGGTLREWAVERAEAELLRVIAEAARGLAAAHAAGLVHRDIKPDNILVGLDGRARVSDFGVAVGRGHGGTPHYMAPEVRAGAPADARSDQWSLCTTALELVPTARKILARGIATDPAARFPSVDVLATALAPRRSPRRWIVATALAATLGAMVPVALTSHAEDPCSNAATPVAAVWNPERVMAFVRRSSHLVTALANGHAYASELVAMRREACERTHSGEQSAGVLDLRMTCLDRRLHRFAAVLDQLGTLPPDPARTSDALTALEPVADCGDVAILQRPVAPPSDVLARGRIAALQQASDQLYAKILVGKTKQASAEVPQLLAQANALGYRPLLAELLVRAGEIAAQLQDIPAAARYLRDGELAAEGAHDDHARIAAMIDSLQVIGVGQRKPADALAIAERASAALEGIGDPPNLRGLLRLATAWLHVQSSNVDAAIREYTEELARDPDELRRAAAHQGLGKIYMRQNRGDLSLAEHQKALAIHRRLQGDIHPMTAESFDDVASVAMLVGDRETALRAAEAARRAYEATLGKDHPHYGRALTILAYIHAATGELELAITENRQALELDERVLGSDNPETTSCRDSYASVLARGGHDLEATTQAERVLRDRLAQFGPTHPAVAKAQAALAELELHGRGYRAALDHARAAYDTQTKVFGASYRAVEEPVMIGEALVHLARARDALPWLELAAKHANATDSAGTHAYIDALLGYALVVTHDRRGERMLHDAMAVLAKDRTLADELARVRALIGSRSARSAARRPR